MSLLEIRDLAVEFHTAHGVVHAVNGVSYSVDAGETVAVVGESGSGKTATVSSILRLLPKSITRITAGQIAFAGADLLQVDDAAIRKVRGGQIGMVFQDPMSALDPRMRIGQQIRETIDLHLQLDRKATHQRVLELLDLVGIADAARCSRNFTHELSGGMRQRVMIAIALAASPLLLIADEPTTALDVTIQAQIIDLVKRLRRDVGMAIIWVTHDLGVVARLADRVVVMYAGKVMEEASRAELFARPRHPYTLALLGASARIDRPIARRLTAIAGAAPDLRDYPHGCPFAERCPYVIGDCQSAPPPLRKLGNGHRLACIRDISDAPLSLASDGADQTDRAASHLPH
jgi:oligopeptide transport system ATP-binding protein